MPQKVDIERKGDLRDYNVICDAFKIRGGLIQLDNPTHLAEDMHSSSQHLFVPYGVIEAISSEHYTEEEAREKFKVYE